MNVQFDKTDDVSGKITVNVEENDYKEKVEKELKEIGRTHAIPGFRKGHVSMGQLIRLFGKQVKSDVLNHEVYNAVIKYIQENKIEILGEPLPVAVKEISLEEKDFTFEYEVGIAPELNVNIDKSIELPYRTIAIDEKMQKEQDDHLRQRFGAQVPGEQFEERGLVKGVMMELDAEGNVKETEDAIQVTSAIVAPFVFKSTDEAAKFAGKKVGDKVVFNPAASCENSAPELASMLQITKEQAANVTSDFQLTISEIIVNRPAELGQEYYDEVFGKDKVKTEEEYNNGVKAMIAAQLAPNSENLFRIQSEKILVEKFGDKQLPAGFLKKWLVARNEGLTEENIDEEYTKMEPSIKWQLIKERIAKQAEIKIEENDILDFAKSIAARQFAQYGMLNLDDETITNYAKRILSDKETRSRIVEEVGDTKLFNALKELATVKSEELTLDQFKAAAEEAQK